MEVLFVAHRAPFPPDKGDRQRGWRHIERLATLGPVDIVAQADSEADAEAARIGLSQVCREVHVFNRRKLEAFAHVGLAFMTGKSLTVASPPGGENGLSIESQARFSWIMTKFSYDKGHFVVGVQPNEVPKSSTVESSVERKINELQAEKMYLEDELALLKTKFSHPDSIV